MIPIPPALEKADDSCERAIQPIAAWMIGFSISSISVMRVLSAMGCPVICSVLTVITALSPRKRKGLPRLEQFAAFGNEDDGQRADAKRHKSPHERGDRAVKLASDQIAEKA